MTGLSILCPTDSLIQNSKGCRSSSKEKRGDGTSLPSLLFCYFPKIEGMKIGHFIPLWEREQGSCDDVTSQCDPQERREGEGWDREKEKLMMTKRKSSGGKGNHNVGKERKLELEKGCTYPNGERGQRDKKKKKKKERKGDWLFFEEGGKAMGFFYFSGFYLFPFLLRWRKRGEKGS